ncbi:MAG: tetratricopeptide repeat protein [SAR324 cluster bacterium]|nr:tetratricopeptide repeat protein [SAR324 cluster bacterium]
METFSFKNVIFQSFLNRKNLQTTILLIILLLMNGCAALQLSRESPEKESSPQTQQILVEENQQELEQLIQENANLRENLTRLEQDLKKLNKRIERQKQDFAMVQEQWETNFALLERSVGATLEDLEQKTLDPGVLAPVEIDQELQGEEELAMDGSESVREIPLPVIETYSLKPDDSTVEMQTLDDEQSLNNLEPVRDVPEDEEPGFVESVELRPEDLEDPIPLEEAAETAIQVAANLSSSETRLQQPVVVSKESEEPEFEDPDLSEPENPVILIRHPGVKKIYNQGMNEVIQRQHESAIRIFENYVKRFPEDMDSDNALYWIGHSYFQLKQNQKAERAFRKILTGYEHRPTSQGYKTPDAIYMLGKISERRRDPVASKYYYRTVIARYPGSVAARNATRDLNRLSQ